MVVDQYDPALGILFCCGCSSCVLTRIVARIPLPLELVMAKLPPSELIREEMFDSPMPQSIIASGLNPRPSSV